MTYNLLSLSIYALQKIVEAGPSGRSSGEIEGSNPTRDVDVCLLLVLYVAR